MSDNNNNDEICCPKFDPEPWDGKEFEWHDKKFIKDSVKTFMFVPVNYGAAMKRLSEKFDQTGAQKSEWFCLSYHRDMWHEDVYLAVDKKIDNSENVEISGKYFSKVYEGSYKDAGKWHKDFEIIVNGRGRKLLKTYFWYTTCPKCAKKYGKNYTVIIGQID
jgi:hypothetical protein